MNRILLIISIAAIVMGIVLIVTGQMLGILVIGGSIYAIVTRGRKKKANERK